MRIPKLTHEEFDRRVLAAMTPPGQSPTGMPVPEDMGTIGKLLAEAKTLRGGTNQ